MSGEKDDIPCAGWNSDDVLDWRACRPPAARECPLNRWLISVRPESLDDAVTYHDVGPRPDGVGHSFPEQVAQDLMRASGGKIFGWRVDMQRSRPGQPPVNQTENEGENRGNRQNPRPCLVHRPRL